MKRLFNSLSSR